MSYEADLAKSKEVSRSPWLHTLYEKKLGSRITFTEHIDEVEDKRKYNYDKRIICEDGQELLIEEKFRFRPIRDLLVETHHVFSDGTIKPGWVSLSNANLLSYVSVTDKNMMLIDMIRLKDFMNTERYLKLKEKKIIYSPTPAINDGYVTHNDAIDWKIIEDENIIYRPSRQKIREKNYKLEWFLIFYIL